MATYYWVGGTGSWVNSAKWSLTSGGAGGAGVPTSVDDVVIDNNSGSGDWQGSISQFTCRNLTVTANASLSGFAYSGASYNTINLYGNLLVSKASFFSNELFSTKSCNLVAYKTGAQSIDFSGNGNSFASLLIKSTSVATVGTFGTTYFSLGNWQVTNRLLTVESGGTLNINGNIFGVQSLVCNSGSTLIFSSAADIYINDSFTVNATTTVTVSNTNATLHLIPVGGSTFTFSGANKTYPNIVCSYDGNYTALPISSFSTYNFTTADTFGIFLCRLSDYVNTKVVLSQNITITNYMSFTVTNSPYSYSYKNYLQSSSSGVARTINLSNQPVIPAKRLTVKDITIVNTFPQAAYVQDGCTDNGNNTNWNFGSVGFGIVLQ